MKRQPGFGFETYWNISDNKFVYLCIPSNVCYDVELSLNRVMSYSKGGRIGLTSLSTGLYCSLIEDNFKRFCSKLTIMVTIKIGHIFLLNVLMNVKTKHLFFSNYKYDIIN